MIRYLEIAFAALVAALAGYVIYEASAWDLQARLFPWVVGFPLLALALVQLVLTIRARPTLVEGGAASEAEAIGFWNPAARRETLRLVAWIAAFLLCIALFSFPIGLPLAMLLYLKVESKESWRLSLVLAGATFAYMYLLFDLALHLAWPEGIVTGLLRPR